LTIAAGDADGDGLTDLVAAGGPQITLFRSRGCYLPLFRRGDADQDGVVQLTDAVRVLLRLFAGAEALPCPDAGDIDDDGELTLTDAVALLVYLFQSGARPPPPGPDECGLDPTEDALPLCRGGCQ
jgi:hypothetical protein